MPKKYSQHQFKQQLETTYGIFPVGDPEPDYKWLWNHRGRDGGRLLSIIQHTNTTWRDIADVLKKVLSLGRALTEEKFRLLYGVEEGRSRWQAYKHKQAASNTFEYKQQNHGWSRQQYDAYNARRAVTLENMTLRYGELEGTKRFDAYRKRQAYTNTKSHLGERYESINRLKSHSIKTYLLRYADAVVAEEKLLQFWQHKKSGKFYSKVSQDLFRQLATHILFAQHTLYFAEHNHEYVLVLPEISRVFKYDFVCPALKICVEFHGDIFHGNPHTTRPDDILTFQKIPAYQMWALDQLKQDMLYSHRGYKTIVIWESSYRQDPLGTAERIIEWVQSNTSTITPSSV